MTDDVNVSVEIDAPADRVWEMVSDVTRMGEWSPESTGGAWVKGATGPELGAKFVGTNRNGSKTWKTLGTVVDADPGRTFAFRVTAGGVKVAVWRYELEPTPAGCRVTERWIDERGWLARTLGKPVSGVADRADHNRRSMEATLERLKAAAESQPSPTS